MGNTCFKGNDDPLGVGERYHLDQLLGRGGGGEVWAATEKVSQSKVALKFISVKGARNWEFVHAARQPRSLSRRGAFL